MDAHGRVLLTNGFIVDGTGRAGWPGSILIEGTKIAAVSGAAGSIDSTALHSMENCPVMDCSGLVISPGFIDLHSHSDVQVVERRTEKLQQGVTFEAVGNCGFSPFPANGDNELLHEFAGGILGRDGAWGWPTADAYVEALVESGADDYAAPLLGHGSLRVAVCGLRQGPSSPGELDRMAGLLEDALSAGCAGFSTGLMYAPGSSAGGEELAHLCRIVARKAKLYSTHMRSYSAGLVEATREQIGLADQTGCRLQISHLQAAGRENWHLQELALAEIESARMRGVDVEFDIYPYQYGSTVLTQLLPQWTLEGGIQALLGRLSNPELSARIADQMSDTGPKLWADVIVSSLDSADNADLIGKHIGEIAEVRGCSPERCAIDLLLEEQANVNIISFNQSEGNLRQLITHTLCSVITDGFYVKGKPHPRLHGTYPELLGELVRNKQWLSLTDAIHKSTGQPAARLRLMDRGLLRRGYRADLTIFDPTGIASRSTYSDPAQSPAGISAVFKNGSVVWGSMHPPARIPLT